jgi:uncharacterized protein YvpB
MLALGGSMESNLSSAPDAGPPASGTPVPGSSAAGVEQAFASESPRRTNEKDARARSGAASAQPSRWTAALFHLDPRPGANRADTHPALLWTLTLIGLTAIALAIWIVRVNSTRSTSSSTAPAPSVFGRSRYATREAQQVEITRLRNDLQRVESALIEAQATVDAHEFAARAGAVSLEKSPLALILDVPPAKQEHSLSCESGAAAMAAQYHGVPVSESEILNALPLHENPHVGFRGNVDGPYGGLEDYGVYAKPIRQVLMGLGLQAEHFEGGIEEIKHQIRQGRPVIAWVTYGFRPAVGLQAPTQMMLSGAAGEIEPVTMVPYEHAILIVGYNQQGLWINDPYDGTRTFVPADEFRRSFAYLGDMALVVAAPAR